MQLFNVLRRRAGMEIISRQAPSFMLERLNGSNGPNCH